MARAMPSSWINKSAQRVTRCGDVERPFSRENLLSSMFDLYDQNRVQKC